MQISWKSALKEVGLAAGCAAAFCLFVSAAFAVLVRAYAPPETVVTAAGWGVKAVGAFTFPLLFIHRGGALVKGAAAGIFSVLLGVLFFAALGGGFRLTGFFALELLFSGVLGGIGGLFGVKLRKEEP